MRDTKRLKTIPLRSLTVLAFVLVAGFAVIMDIGPARADSTSGKIFSETIRLSLPHPTNLPQAYIRHHYLQSRFGQDMTPEQASSEAKARCKSQYNHETSDKRSYPACLREVSELYAIDR